MEKYSIDNENDISIKNFVTINCFVNATNHVSLMHVIFA